MEDQSSNRYVLTQISEHTFKLDDMLTLQTWNIEILKENNTLDSAKESAEK